jgi:hypothetical protein
MGGDDAALAEDGTGADVDRPGVGMDPAALAEDGAVADDQSRARRDVEAHAAAEAHIAAEPGSAA